MSETRLPIGKALPNWKPPARPARTAMWGHYCSVTPLDPKAHRNDLFTAFATDQDGRDWLYLPYGPFLDVADFSSWLDSAAEKDDPLFFSVIDTTGKASGLASYLRITPDSGSIEVGHIHFSPELQRTPAATEAMYLMMKHAFELGYRRYEWKCDALNERSRRAALRLGLSFEGIFRQATVVKGRNRDTAWYAAIDSEWPALQAAFQLWLSLENFDSAGQQRIALRTLTEPIVSKQPLGI